MWVIKQQTKTNPSGKQVSPVMETQSGAEKMLALLKEQAAASPDEDVKASHFFIAAYVKRGSKK